MLSSLLSRLNHINPSKPKTNYLKLAKSLVAIFILISVTLKIIPIFAQDTPPPEDTVDTSVWDDFASSQQEARSNISAQSWGKAMFENTLTDVLESQIGTIPTTSDIQQSITDNGAYIPGGMLGATNNLIAQTYTQPASGVQYLAQLKDNLLGVKPAYAQGVGFVGLEPLLPIWRGFRNIVYLLSTVFFVVLGIMVMFRLKINPQTVLTVQNAVPQVITTLLLVTFSYAIAGLLIDLTYFIQNVVLILLFQVQGKTLNQNLFSEFTGLPTILKQFNFKNLSDAALGDIFRLTALALPGKLIFILGTILGALIGGVIGLLGGPIGAGVGAVTGPLIFMIILTIIIIVSLLGFFFGLIKAYVNIIFKIVLAPLEIGLGAIPGMKIGFSSWSNNLFANLLIFPICLIFLVIANIIIEKTSGTSGLWAPTMVKYNLPGTLTSLVTGTSGGLVPIAVGFVTVLMMGKLPAMIPQVFFAIKPSGLESAIGQNMQSIGNFAKSIPSRAQATGEMIYNYGSFVGSLRSGNSLGQSLGLIFGGNRYLTSHPDVADRIGANRSTQVQGTPTDEGTTPSAPTSPGRGGRP